MNFYYIIALLAMSSLLIQCADEKSDKAPSSQTVSMDAADEAVKEEIDYSEDVAEVATNEDEATTSTTNNPNAEAAYDPDVAATVPSSRGRAKLAFAEKTYYFGEIEEGDLVNHEFKFTNTGSGDLVINSATASCGCTRPDFPFVPIKAGETGSIKVTFDSKGKLGVQRKAVTVTSNSSPRVVRVYLEGKVVEKSGNEEVAPVLQADQEDSTSSN